MSLICQRCGHQGGADLSFIWFAKTFKVKSKEPEAPRRERTLWLCPDCSAEIGSERQCAAFLQKELKG
jgi:hypothetical protein